MAKQKQPKMQQVEVTAYELMRRVAQDIRLAPLNYFQGDWACDAKDPLVEARDRYDDDDHTPITQANIKAATERIDAACGTSFCRAGWMATHLVNPVGMQTKDWANLQFKAQEEEENAWRGGIYILARNVLLDAGISRWAIENLFEGDAVSGTPGTQAYANAGAKGVREFMRQYASELKAHKVMVWEEVR